MPVWIVRLIGNIPITNLSHARKSHVEVAKAQSFSASTWTPSTNASRHSEIHAERGLASGLRSGHKMGIGRVVSFAGGSGVHSPRRICKLLG